MADGSTKPIERVQAGDLVLTRDQNDDANGKVVAKRVLSTSVREAQATATVTLLTGENIECTPEHPFYAAGRGFVEAKSLGIGTSIVTRAGPSVQVASVERHDAPATVYNFVVEDTHTYFVGTANGGVEVHNGPCFGENQQALLNLVDDASAGGKQAVSRADADTLLGWAKEYAKEDGAFLKSHGPEIHPGRPVGQYEHFHIGPKNHIFIDIMPPR